MSTELTIQSSDQAVMSQGITAGASLRSLIPTTFEGVWQMARVISVSPFCPKDMGTMEACASAIMLGLDIGLNPIQAVQSIAVINGRPSIWGDAALALCLGNTALCEDIHEEFHGDPNKEDTWYATCTAKRKGRAHPVVGTFSYADAKRALLWDKAGPWKNYPKRMLQLRARAFALRDAFPDIMKGLAMREEMDDVPDIRRDLPAGTLRPPGSGADGTDVIDAVAREVKTEPAQAKPEETKPAEPDAKKADPKPAPKKDEPKPAEQERSTATHGDGKPGADFDNSDPAGRDHPNTETGKPAAGVKDIGPFPGDAKKTESAAQPAYNGGELLAEFSEALDNIHELEILENYIGYIGTGKTKKPNRGMQIYDLLNETHMAEAKDLYTDAKARIAEENSGGDTQGGDADETQQGQGTAGGDGGGEQQDGDADQVLDPSQMDFDQYETYVSAYINAATLSKTLKRQWFDESEIRDAFKKAGKIDEKRAVALQAKWKAKVAALSDNGE